MTDERIVALQILVEQLIVERCLITDDPEGTAAIARHALAQLEGVDRRVTAGVAAELDAAMLRVLEKLRLRE